jgi:antitoxin ParD1/3/4
MSGRSIQVTLPDELDEAVRTSVARGEYPDESAVIRSAIAGWSARRAAEERLINEIGFEELRRLWDEGVASGPGEDLSIEEIKQRARQRLRAAE